MTPEERDILEHTTGWRSRTPLYRNHFCTGPECDNWDTIQELCRRGLMRLAREPSELSGGDHVFTVTPMGITVLQEPEPVRKRKRAGGSR